MKGCLDLGRRPGSKASRWRWQLRGAGLSRSSASSLSAWCFCMLRCSLSLPSAQFTLEAMKTSDAVTDSSAFFFFFFPVNVENFREALHIALPDVGWVGSSQDLRTVRRDHRTTQMYPMCLCHVLYADRREKLIKKMPKLRSCLYREIFSLLISAWDMQSNWNKEGENLAQHFHFVFPTFPFNSSGKSGFWITEPSELLLFSEKLRFSVIICAVWITNDWHIHERCCIDRKWSTAL